MLLTNFAANDISFLRCNNFLPTNIIKFQIKVYTSINIYITKCSELVDMVLLFSN